MGLGEGFTRVASEYDRVRPDYPRETLDSLMGYADIDTGDHVLEVAGGTGKLTKHLLERGAEVTMVEPGEEMLEMTRAKLGQYERDDQLHLVQGRFLEAAQDGRVKGVYDAVVVGTAWKWLGDSERVAAAAHTLLRPASLPQAAGSLAIVNNIIPISDNKGDAFFRASRPAHQRHTQNPLMALPDPSSLRPETLDSTLFDLRHFGFSVEIDVFSTAETYLGRIATLAPIIALEAAARTALFDELTNLIQDQFNGQVTTRRAVTLTVAQKV